MGGSCICDADYFYDLYIDLGIACRRRLDGIGHWWRFWEALLVYYRWTRYTQVANRDEALPVEESKYI